MNSSATLKRLDKLLAKARAQHRGLPLYKLSGNQRRRYEDWQARQPKDYQAILAGTSPEQEPLDRDIAEALGLDGEPPGIPTDATEQEAYEIYQDYLENAL